MIYKLEFVSSSKDANWGSEIYITSFNLEIMIGKDTEETINELFNSLLHRYQEMKCSKFVFNFADGMCYKFHVTSLNLSGSQIGSSNWIKNKGAALNPKNNDYRCFQCTVTVALNHESIVIQTKLLHNILMPFCIDTEKLYKQ